MTTPIWLCSSSDFFYSYFILLTKKCFSFQFTGLLKILAHESAPPLRNLTVLPLLLSQDRDETVFQLTEGRIPVFSHDLVPDYLRTKLEPVTEERLLGYEQKVNIDHFALFALAYDKTTKTHWSR